MRSILIRSLLAAAGLAIVWLFSARQISLLIDRFKTVRVRSLPVTPIALDYDMLQFGELRLELRDSASAPTLRAYEAPDKRMMLALGASTFALDPADDISLSEERSVLSWPTPFEMNFMTGHSPSWKRNVYTRLVWKKRSGARLELLWRYEQWFYGGLGGWSDRMTRAGATGLIRTDLRQ